MQIFTPKQHVRSGCHANVERDNFETERKGPLYLVQLKEIIIINQLNDNLTSVPLSILLMNN